MVSAPLPVPNLFDPAEALRFEVGGFGLDAHVGCRSGAVRLAEGVAAGDQRDGFLIVHRHAPESVANVFRRGDRVRLAVRAFGVHVNQAHLHGGERVLEIARVRVVSAVVVGDQYAAGLRPHRASRAIAQVATQPGGLAAPVHVLVRLPDVRATATEAKGLEAHGLQRDVAG